jgi:hypothetical protein
MRLAEQVSHREPDVEGRVPEMCDFVIEQHESVGMDQYVLRTEVSMNQAVAVRPRLINHLREKSLRRRHLLRGVKVVGLDAQRLEICAVVEGVRYFVQPHGRPGVNICQELSKGIDMVQLKASGEKHRFPVFMGLRHCVHGQQVDRLIFETQHRNGDAEVSQPTQSRSLAMNPLGAAEPINRHAKLRQCLLQDP